MRSTLLVAALAACSISTGDGFLLPTQPTKCISRQLQCQQKASALVLGSAVSSNGELQAGISAIDAANPALYDKLSRLRDNTYFKLFSVDILASCEYMPQELFECYSETCEIYPVDEDEVRKNDLNISATFHPFGVCQMGCPSE